MQSRSEAERTKAAAQTSAPKQTVKAPAPAQKAAQRDPSGFDDLPGHERSAYQPNGNGHTEPAGRPQWKNPDEAKAWAAKQTDAAGVCVYGHARHVDASYDKLRREALASTTPPKTAAEFFDLWYAHVQAKVDEANVKLAAELDKTAAGDEQPRF
jgi:hypothetical protein